jgi:hypothetical protein
MPTSVGMTDWHRPYVSLSGASGDPDRRFVTMARLMSLMRRTGRRTDPPAPQPPHHPRRYSPPVPPIAATTPAAIGRVTAPPAASAA